MKLKKVTVCEDNLWECDIHYLIKNNDIHTCFNETKKFLYQLQGLECKFSIQYFIFVDN